MFKIADIDKLARQRLYGCPVVSTVEDTQMTSGTPMFTEDDIHRTQDGHACSELDILLRSIFVKKRISKEYFNGKCREYALGMNLLPSQANTAGSNLVRTLNSGNITISRFFEALQVLGWSLLDLQVKVKTVTGSVETYNIQDAVPSSGK